MSKKVMCFYMVITMLVVGKVGMTLYERSSNVHHGQRVAALQQAKAELINEKQTITAQLATQTALTDINQTAETSGFTPIDQPVVITTGQKLASRDL